MPKPRIVPTISQDLLVYVQGVFPDQLPRDAQAASDIAGLIGEQRVIDHLKHLFKKQQDDKLSGGN